MNFFEKVKGFFGIGAPKVTIETLSPNPYKKDYVLEGKAKIVTKKPSKILGMKATFQEKVTTGRGEDEKVKTTEYGSTLIWLDGQEAKCPMTLEAGKEYVADFKLTNIELIRDLAKDGGALGALGKVGNAVTSKKIEYLVAFEVDVEGTPFDPSAERAVAIDWSSWDA